MPNLDDNEIPDWRVRLMMRLGVPTSALVLIGVSFYRVAVWTGENVVAPIVTRQVRTLETMEDLLKSAERYARENQVLLQENTKILQKQEDSFRILIERIEQLEKDSHPK